MAPLGTTACVLVRTSRDARTRDARNLGENGNETHQISSLTNASKAPSVGSFGQKSPVGTDHDRSGPVWTGRVHAVTVPWRPLHLSASLGSHAGFQAHIAALPALLRSSSGPKCAGSRLHARDGG